MSKTVQSIICFLAVIMIFVGGLFLINRIEYHEEAQIYNNGICIDCGGPLVQYDSWFDKASGNIFNGFSCDRCHEKYAFKFFGEN